MKVRMRSSIAVVATVVSILSGVLGIRAWVMEGQPIVYVLFLAISALALVVILCEGHEVTPAISVSKTKALAKQGASTLAAPSPEYINLETENSVSRKPCVTANQKRTSTEKTEKGGSEEKQLEDWIGSDYREYDPSVIEDTRRELEGDPFLEVNGAVGSEQWLEAHLARAMALGEGLRVEAGSDYDNR